MHVKLRKRQIVTTLSQYMGGMQYKRNGIEMNFTQEIIEDEVLKTGVSKITEIFEKKISI